MNKPRPEPFLPEPVDPRVHLNKFHRRLLHAIIDGGSGSGLRAVLVNRVLGRRRIDNSRLRTRVLAALLGLEQASYVRRDGGNVALTVDGWLAVMSQQGGSGQWRQNQNGCA